MGWPLQSPGQWSMEFLSFAVSSGMIKEGSWSNGSIEPWVRTRKGQDRGPSKPLQPTGAAITALLSRRLLLRPRRLSLVVGARTVSEAGQRTLSPSPPDRYPPGLTLSVASQQGPRPGPCSCEGGCDNITARALRPRALLGANATDNQAGGRRRPLRRPTPPLPRRRMPSCPNR
jgi:hypothetical protein